LRALLAKSTIQHDHVERIPLVHRKRRHANRHQRQGSHGGEHLGLVQEPQLPHEWKLATWERDLVNDDDDQLIREEVSQDAPTTKSFGEGRRGSQGVSLARLSSAQQKKRLQALVDEERGAEIAVNGAQRAEARAMNRVNSLETQVKNLKGALSAASADAAQLLLETKVKENETAAAFMHAQHLALSLEETKSKYHLTNTAAKTFAADLRERQSDETEARRLVDQIQREVADLTTHARHVQSDLDNATKAFDNATNVVDVQKRLIQTPAVANSAVAQLTAERPSVAKQQFLNHSAHRLSTIPTASHRAMSVARGKTTKQLGKVGKAALPSLSALTTVQRNRLSVGVSKGLRSFGKPTDTGSIPVALEPRFDQIDALFGQNAIGTASKVVAAQKTTQRQPKKTLPNEEVHRGDSTQSAASNVLLTMQSIGGTLAQWLPFFGS